MKNIQKQTIVGDTVCNSYFGHVKWLKVYEASCFSEPRNIWIYLKKEKYRYIFAHNIFICFKYVETQC